MTGLIVKAISGFYYVKTGDNVIECKARGKFRNSGTFPLVGDIVNIEINNNNKGTVVNLCERKNFLQRPTVANVDKLFIISSSSTPAPNFLIIDRLTALCEHKDIEPIIVFNKSDIEPLTHFADVYNIVGYKTIICSAKNNSGVDKIIDELYDCVSVFTGNSGVGKSSILNALFPELELATSNVSEKLGRGKHTTRYVELYAHKYNGYVADTPGFSSLESDIGSIDFKNNLVNCFPEFINYSKCCRFKDCKHIGESGCAVLDAVNNHDLPVERYNSYTTIFNELRDLKAWNFKKAER